MPPSKLQKKAAESYIGKLKATYGNEWMQQAGQFGTHNVKGENLTLEEVLRRAELPGVPKPTVTSTDKRGFTTRDVTVNGKRMLAGYDPDSNTYYAPGDTTTPLTGDIQEYNPPQAPPSQASADARTNSRIDRIVNSFNAHPIVKEFNEVQSQRGIIQQVVNGAWSGPGDMAVVFAFMKALDPNSVVRETEYANAAKSGNIFAGWAARFNGALNPNGGFLSEQVRRDFLRIIESRLSVKTKQYENLRRQLVQRVDRIKAGASETGDEALLDYESAMPTEAPSGQPQRRTPRGPAPPNPYRK
jgi:hypothetical protein